MRRRTLVKICGVKNLKEAQKAIEAGSDFIGMVFFQGSSREALIADAHEISTAAKKHGCKTVGVFVDKSKEDMMRLANDLNLDYLQLHSPYAIQEGFNVMAKKIFVVGPDMPFDFQKANPESDFLLYDWMQGGTGKLLEWSKIAPPKEFKWFLGGGLNQKNVGLAIRTLHPNGVDVSSGVEKGTKGIKDEMLIQEFIQAVENGEAAR